MRLIGTKQTDVLMGDIVDETLRDDLYAQYRDKFNNRAALFQHHEVGTKAKFIFNVIAGGCMAATSIYVWTKIGVNIPIANQLMGSMTLASILYAGFAGVYPLGQGRRYNRVQSEIEGLAQQIKTAFPDTVWKSALDGLDVSMESMWTIMSFTGDLPYKPKQISDVSSSSDKANDKDNNRLSPFPRMLA
jgi:hypothetical protein